jgi:hypothetical protein
MWARLVSSPLSVRLGFAFTRAHPSIFPLTGVISSVTAGNVYFHPRFDPGRDRDAVHEEIRRIVGQEVVYNTTLRVRCSNSESATSDLS